MLRSLTCPQASLSQHREDLQQAAVDSVQATRMAGTTEPDLSPWQNPFPPWILELKEAAQHGQETCCPLFKLGYQHAGYFWLKLHWTQRKASFNSSEGCLFCCLFPHLVRLNIDILSIRKFSISLKMQPSTHRNYTPCVARCFVPASFWNSLISKEVNILFFFIFLHQT